MKHVHGRGRSTAATTGYGHRFLKSIVQYCQKQAYQKCVCNNEYKSLGNTCSMVNEKRVPFFHAFFLPFIPLLLLPHLSNKNCSAKEYILDVK